MKRFICWYAYRGHETEGRLDIEEPKIYQGEDMHEALWKWHNERNPKFREFYKDLSEYREKDKEPCTWGIRCEELKSI